MLGIEPVQTAGKEIREWIQLALLFMGFVGTVIGLLISWFYQRQNLQDQEFRGLFERFSDANDAVKVTAVVALGSFGRTDNSRTSRYRSQVVPFLILALENESSKPVRDAIAHSLGQIGSTALLPVAEANRTATKAINNLLSDLQLALRNEGKPELFFESPYSRSLGVDMMAFARTKYLFEPLELNVEEGRYLFWLPWRRGAAGAIEDQNRPVRNSDVLVNDLKRPCALLRGTVEAIASILRIIPPSRRPKVSLHNLHLWGADLKNVNLDDCILTSTNLGLADLTDASLRRANISWAIFYKTGTTGLDRSNAKQQGLLEWNGYEGNWRRNEST